MAATAILERPARPTLAVVGASAQGDPALLARVRAGDDRAFALVYERHVDVVFGVASRVARNRQVARDVVQEVFAHLWQHPDRVDLERGTLRTFLAVVAHRRAVDEVRRHARRERTETKAATRARARDDDHGDDVADRSEATWRGARLTAALADLPDEQRAAVELAYFGGHTYKEVATLLGIPEGTAKSRLRLALQRLRAPLAEDLGAPA